MLWKLVFVFIYHFLIFIKCISNLFICFILYFAVLLINYTIFYEIVHAFSFSLSVSILTEMYVPDPFTFSLPPPHHYLNLINTFRTDPVRSLSPPLTGNQAPKWNHLSWRGQRLKNKSFYSPPLRKSVLSSVVLKKTLTSQSLPSCGITKQNSLCYFFSSIMTDSKPIIQSHESHVSVEVFGNIQLESTDWILPSNLSSVFTDATVKTCGALAVYNEEINYLSRRLISIKNNMPCDEWINKIGYSLLFWLKWNVYFFFYSIN